MFSGGPVSLCVWGLPFRKLMLWLMGSLSHPWAQACQCCLLIMGQAVKYWKFVPDCRLRGSEWAQARIYSLDCSANCVRHIALKPFVFLLHRYHRNVLLLALASVLLCVCVYRGMMRIHYWKCSLRLKRIHKQPTPSHALFPAELGIAQMHKDGRQKFDKKEWRKKSDWIRSTSDQCLSSAGLRGVELPNLCLTGRNGLSSIHVALVIIH